MKYRDLQFKAAGCVRCEDNSLRLQSDRPMGQTHRHGPEAPPLRHLRAAAAIEREDRAASSSALHVVFPTTEVTKPGAARKSGRRFLTRDAAADLAAEEGVDSLPQRSSDRLTRYRDTGNFVSPVTGTHRRWERQGRNRSGARLEMGRSPGKGTAQRAKRAEARGIPARRVETA